MKSTLPQPVITQLHRQGSTLAAGSPFVNPYYVVRVKVVAQLRGRDWVDSITGRDTWSRRSISQPDWPWFRDGEMEAIVLADAAELEHDFAALA